MVKVFPTANKCQYNSIIQLSVIAGWGFIQYHHQLQGYGIIRGEKVFHIFIPIPMLNKYFSLNKMVKKTGADWCWFWETIP